MHSDMVRFFFRIFQIQFNPASQNNIYLHPDCNAHEACSIQQRDRSIDSQQPACEQGHATMSEDKYGGLDR